jgi:hypothetical protein
MRFLLFITAFFLIATESYSQKIKLTLFDEVDHSPIQYASICFKKSKKACLLSDSLGVVFLDELLNDSLEISRVGYSTKIISLQELKANNSVHLARNTRMLPTVILSKNEFSNLTILGNAKKRNGSISLIPNLELGRFFGDLGKNKFLKSVIIFLKTQVNTDYLFLLEIYDFDMKKMKPTNQLASQLVLLRAKDNYYYKHIIDLENVLPVKENVFVSLKYLGSHVPGSRIELFTSNRWKSSSTYERYLVRNWSEGSDAVFLKNSIRKGNSNILMQIEVMGK